MAALVGSQQLRLLDRVTVRGCCERSRPQGRERRNNDRNGAGAGSGDGNEPETRTAKGGGGRKRGQESATHHDKNRVEDIRETSTLRATNGMPSDPMDWEVGRGNQIPGTGRGEQEQAVGGRGYDARESAKGL